MQAERLFREYLALMQQPAKDSAFWKEKIVADYSTCYGPPNLCDVTERQMLDKYRLLLADALDYPAHKVAVKKNLKESRYMLAKWDGHVDAFPEDCWYEARREEETFVCRQYRERLAELRSMPDRKSDVAELRRLAQATIRPGRAYIELVGSVEQIEKVIEILKDKSITQRPFSTALSPLHIIENTVLPRYRSKVGYYPDPRQLRSGDLIGFREQGTEKHCPPDVLAFVYQDSRGELAFDYSVNDWQESMPGKFDLPLTEAREQYALPFDPSRW